MSNIPFEGKIIIRMLALYVAQQSLLARGLNVSGDSIIDRAEGFEQYILNGKQETPSA